MMKLVLDGCNIFYKDKKILSNVCMNVDTGIHLLIGPNGAGKSTLLNAIAGISNYRIEGNAFFNNLDLSNTDLETRVKNGVVLIPQHLPKNTYVTLREFINVLSLKGYNCETSFLDNFYDRILYKDFSGGESKIVDFHIALSLKPKLLLIDEIDSGLDQNNIKKVAQLLVHHINKHKGIALLVTHRQEILKYIPNIKSIFSIKNHTVIKNSDF